MTSNKPTMNDDILDSVGGSLLNDLLSDLNAAVDLATNQNDSDDGGDDLFALLEQELTSSYNAPLPTSAPGSGGIPPSLLGMGGPQPAQQRSAAAFVVNQQQANNTNNPLFSSPPPAATPRNNNTIGGGGGGGDDAWSSALSQFGTQFGGMSLAADFLAADSATKAAPPAPPGMSGGEKSNATAAIVPPEKLFEGEDYEVEEEVTLEETGGLAALLGASTARTAEKSKAVKEKERAPAEKEERENTAEIVPAAAEDNARPGPMGPPQGMMPRGMPPPGQYLHPMMHGMPPMGPGGMMPPPIMMMPGIPAGMMGPPSGGMIIPGMGMMGPPPPGGGMGPGGEVFLPGMMPHHPMMMNPRGMMPPPQGPPGPGMMGLPQGGPQGPGMMGPPPPQQQQQRQQVKEEKVLSTKDFPALGETPPEEESESEEEEKAEEEEAPPAPTAPPVAVAPFEEARFYFNNTNPAAAPVNAKTVASKLMPARDVSFIVNVMLRPLQSLDAYNDDYYHFSMMQKRSQQQGVGGGIAKPIFKDVKANALRSELNFLEAKKDQANKFAEENRGLGRTVKTNVKRPKALLTTPVLNKENVADDDGDAGAGAKDSKYESEQRRNRISLWKARVSVDRGYGAFLSLIELRRLIQANVGAPQLISELMVDVKNNVDKLHSSLGVAIKVGGENNKKVIEIDEGRLSSALTLPKGRVLCARVIEDGILPHPSACQILPVALRCILASTSPVSADNKSTSEGEDRLLHALTGLVRTHQPNVDPAILLKCLEELSSLECDASAITGKQKRMELVHSILSIGKVACGDVALLKEGWCDKEKAFMQILAGAQQ